MISPGWRTRQEYRYLSAPRIWQIKTFRAAQCGLNVASGRSTGADNHPHASLFVFKTDFEDFEFVGTGGNCDFHALADFLSDKALSQWAGDIDLSGVVVLFAGADERELLGVA